MSVTTALRRTAGRARDLWRATAPVEPATREVLAARRAERLRAWFCATAHPATDRLVAACVRYGVLDLEENRNLRRLLPLTLVGEAGRA